MHRDSIDRFEVRTIPSLMSYKRLGTYLIEAGLINEAQVEVALNDQLATGMKFGEVLATRGWVKQQTVEYLMQKVVIPERNAEAKKNPQATSQAARAKAQPGATPIVKQQVAQQDASRRSAQRSAAPSRSPSPASAVSDVSFTRRDAPITKPLPSVPNGGDEVSWVG